MPTPAKPTSATTPPAHVPVATPTAPAASAPAPSSSRRRPCIGVFDSGFGGLTVLRELLELAPGADYVYLGDSARLPYGSKSAQTVARYATSAARFLVEQGADMLVIACNSASAMAMAEIKAAVSVDVVGVIEPGARSAWAATKTGRVCVIGTQATVASHAYRRALEQKGVRVEEKACPLFVPLVEEGWTDHPVTEQVARIYLDELCEAAKASWQELTPAPLPAPAADPHATPVEEAPDGPFAGSDVLVLGCTHYPLLKPLLERVLPPSVKLVDPAQATALVVAERLGRATAMRDDGQAGPRTLRVFATDGVDRFRTLGSQFLGHPVENVELVVLPE